MPRPFLQLDVFGSGPFSGNPLAVVLDAVGLADEEMAQISAWTNLSECTFLLPPTSPEADYRVRIFNLDRELPFAGHPTLGSAAAWLAAGGVARTAGVVVQECGAGLVPVRVAGDLLSFAAPPLVRSGPVDATYLDVVMRLLGVSEDDVVDAAWVDNGPGWVGVLLRDAEAVLALEPDLARVRDWTSVAGATGFDVGVVAPYVGVGGEHGGVSAGLEPPAEVEVRAFFTDGGGRLVEDPVTGSLNASLAQWLLGSGRLVAPYVASQGTRLGRVGRVYVTADSEGIWVGGRAEVTIRGEIEV